MVVTRQSTHRDGGETGEESHSEPPPAISRTSMEFQPPMTFVFQPPQNQLNQPNTAEEFDIPEETDSIQCESETKETASEITEIARRSDVSPSRGGSEVVRLLASLHDLSRQMEITMVDLRAQLGNQLGSQSWSSGDYDLPEDSISQRERPGSRGIKQIRRAISHTWGGVVCRVLTLWQLICLRFPVATGRLTELSRKLRTLLPALGYLLLAHILYGVYTTHQKLVEQQRRRAVPWL
ncbi:uncharacterized protein LOC122376425 [Amphibalanus amphitrite]|uniref:uncharacterized protein LOC122376425 n=1 Tax=Amphibalanus amphitrite TaxID=1232801 RepID=UPI001C92A209|nr:uncharacterized protein LOC122376425 [Amphibalanus amphitrite]